MDTYSGFLVTTYDAAASTLLGDDHWRVLAPFTYLLSPTQRINIPAGYLTDGASVPRLFWNIIPPWGRYGQAAVVHDLLCEYLEVEEDGGHVKISRATCDSVLNQAMQDLGVPTYKRLMIYWGVCAYRLTIGTTKPNPNPIKQKLEREWTGV